MKTFIVDIFLILFNAILYINLSNLLILFLLMLLLPVIISIIYLNKIKLEENDIEINLNFVRDPAYFGKNFLKIIECTFINYFKKYNPKLLDKIENLIIETDLCKENRKSIIFITNNFYNINKLKEKTSKSFKNKCDIIIINKKI